MTVNRFQRLRIQRRGGRRLTYINVFSSPHGIVLSADGQETTGCYKHYRDKLEVFRFPKLEVVIGGSGHGTLIDGFIKVISRRLQRLQHPNKPSVEREIERALKQFRRNDVKQCQDKEKDIAFLIATRFTADNSVALWATMNIRAREIEKGYWPIGYESSFCNYVGRRFYSPTLSLEQVVLLSAYATKIAKDTMEGTSFDSSIVIVTQDGIFEVPLDDVKSMENRLGDYDARFSKLMLACADTHLDVDEFGAILDEFSRAMLRWRANNLQAVGVMKFWQMMTTGRKSEAIHALPRTAFIEMHEKGIVVTDDPERHRKKMEFLKDALEGEPEESG